MTYTLDTLVPIEVGKHYLVEGWSQKLMTFAQFIDEYILLEKSKKEEGECSGSNSQIGYLAQVELFDLIPALRKDIAIPSYCSIPTAIGEEEDLHVNAWFVCRS